MDTLQAFNHQIVETIEPDGALKIQVRTTVNPEIFAQQSITVFGPGSDPVEVVKARFIAYLKRQTEVALVAYLQGPITQPPAPL